MKVQFDKSLQNSCKPLGNTHGESNKKVIHFVFLYTRAHAAMCNCTVENGVELELSCSRMGVSEIISGR